MKVKPPTILRLREDYKLALIAFLPTAMLDLLTWTLVKESGTCILKTSLSGPDVLKNH